MSLIVTIHKRDARTIIAVCDKELLGKTFTQGNKQLDLSSEFYKGEEKTTEETGDLIRNADGVNLVGKDSVKLGIQEGVIDEENIVKIDGIPSAQATLIQQ